MGSFDGCCNGCGEDKTIRDSDVCEMQKEHVCGQLFNKTNQFLKN
jgi:hypothetical protein